MKFFLKSLISLFFLTIGGPSGFSQEASDWAEGDFSKARLITSHKAVPQNGQTLYLGLQIKMEEGWKTYWRSPGDAGQPPVIDWSGSVNLADVRIHYPMPMRFELFKLQTYGYPDEVVYPIEISPAIEGAPVTISATVNYLVCKDLCVPVTADFSLSLPPAKGEAPLSLHSGLIDKALEQVPDKGGESVEIGHLQLLGPAGVQNLLIRLKGENLMTGADIIIEDKENFSFGIPRRRVLSEANEVEFIIPVTATGKNKNLNGEKVLMTLSDGWGNLSETEVVLEQK